MTIVAGQRAQHAPQSLVQAGSLMIDAARAIAQKHSADELAEPLNEFSSHLEEHGFARLASWPLEPRRAMLAELQSMRRLEFLFFELNRYLANVPSPSG
jgi:hypothetical protein